MPETRVLIISTWEIPCGIASFAAVLKSHLDGEFAVDVAPLDPDMLKRFPKPFGDAAIADIVARAADYDVVNIQLEWGTLGTSLPVITRRFEQLLRCNAHIILTLHTPVSVGDGGKLTSHLKRLRLLSAAKCLPAEGARLYYDRRKRLLIRDAAARLGNGFHVIVHTARERKYVTHLCGVANTHDHPLSHIRPDWPERLQRDAPALRARLAQRFGEGKTLVGFFGFLGARKGLETAIGALELLPENHLLLIYGAIHPDAITRDTPIDPYLARVLTRLGYGNLLPAKPESSARAAKGAAKTDAALPEEEPLKKRVFFMGSPDDYEFAEAIAAMDACVFPYLETGQSASGPVCQAVELDKPTYLSRALNFLELEKYFPGRFRLFDIGNCVQLAQQLSEPPIPPASPLPYSMATQRELYAGLIRELAG
ncbi:MAG: hypothetical protein LBR29_11865 [Methylobacteriaceae bacterium]|jgi:glycosyltransferase involved in cell wall biosynthesis|nr:hypothetical protein [Methylobacteriaceae bacterium]